MTKPTTPLPFDEIRDIIESFQFEIDEGGPDASNICVPIDDTRKIVRHIQAQSEQIKRLREALDDIVCIADPEMYDEGSHSIPLEDCQKLAQEALKEASHD
jgi:hypothetical protein